VSRIIKGHHHTHDHHDESQDLIPILKKEVLEHLPFTLLGLVFGTVLIVVGSFAFRMILSEEAFHASHFLHIFFSAAAASALMTYYESSYGRSVVMGMIISILICTLSDTVIPYWGAQVMGKTPEFHICGLEHPIIVFLIALVGTNVGLIWLKGFEHCSHWSHLFHIFVSSAASGIYLFSFSQGFVMNEVLGVLLILFTAIFIPCLISDVVIPLLSVHPSFFIKRIFRKS